ncbi:hypothetical protein EZS27_029150, partial [termite gut metagenome]
YHTVLMREFDVFQVVNIMYGSFSQVKTEENTLYRTDSMKFVSTLSHFFKDEYELNQKELIIKLYNHHCENDYTLFLLEKLIETNFFAFYKTDNNEIIFRKEQQKSPVSEDKLREILNGTIKSYHYARYIIPCIEKYFKLRLKDNAFISYINREHFLYDINLPYPQMVSPYIAVKEDVRESHLERKLNDKLYDWVYENRYDEKTTLEEIKSAYNSFTEEFSIEKII